MLFSDSITLFLWMQKILDQKNNETYKSKPKKCKCYVIGRKIHDWSNTTDIVQVLFDKNKADKYVREVNSKINKLRKNQKEFQSLMKNWVSENPKPSKDRPAKPKIFQFRNNDTAYRTAMINYHIKIKKYDEYFKNYPKLREQYENNLARTLSNSEFSASELSKDIINEEEFFVKEVDTL
jgi:hypothetical protein